MKVQIVLKATLEIVIDPEDYGTPTSPNEPPLETIRHNWEESIFDDPETFLSLDKTQLVVTVTKVE
jgi:hypothetical protein